MIRSLRITAAVTAAVAACALGVRASQTARILPSGWRLTPALAAVNVGTMPQGIAISPDGSQLAIVESGVETPVLRILAVPALTQRAAIELPGAFGKPVWEPDGSVLVAGANAGAVLRVDPRSKRITHAMEGAAGSWPAAVALGPNGSIAAADEGNGSVSIDGRSIPVGAYPADVVFSPDGKRVYASVQELNQVAVIDAAAKTVLARIRVGLHPGALALSAGGRRLYVAETDEDSVGVVDTEALRQTVNVRLAPAGARAPGVSPNALLLRGGDLFVSLAAEDAMAIVRGDRVVERVPAGWYPTGIAAAADGTLYECNGFGERDRPNPQFDPLARNPKEYVADLTVGSVRAVPRWAYRKRAYETERVLSDAAPLWTPLPASRTVLHAGGPIRHVIYVIKENRSYDQVLGDLGTGDGDAHLTMFGAKITPNQHAIERRFGIFDNAYANSLVSADGHNWTDAAFANDFVERHWPVNYGGRMKNYVFQTGTVPDVPQRGYLWDDAARAHLTYRDYGEDIDFSPSDLSNAVNTFPGLTGHFDPRFVGWDLGYSDGARYAEWRREFRTFVAHRNLPSLEIVYFPNDHTSGTRAGSPTPQAYVATNDWAVGRLVQSVSRSPYWRDTAIFILEDDAQNGPDHVSDQRSTFYVASPYARPGVHHAHYSTASFVHTIELILGLPPLSAYDANARPLYDAFSLRPANAAPFSAIRPSTPMDARNAPTAYRASDSARLDWSRADAADPRVLNDVLLHAAPSGR